MFYFFMLMCDFLAPTDRERIELFSSLRIRRHFQKKKTRNGMQFLKVGWIEGRVHTIRSDTR
jgi:hypothetical protein